MSKPSSNSWQVMIERRAEKVMRRLDKSLRKRLDNAIQALANNPYPSNSRKLVGKSLSATSWRLANISSLAGTNFVEANPMNQVFLCAQQAKVDGYRRMIDITFQDGDVYRCSLADSSERLRLAHPSLVEEWEWIGPQAGIHWAAVDEDLSIEYLVNKGHLVGNQEMVRTKSPLLVPVF